ncbi:SH3 domain-containing protein [Butyrivibrio sp. XBB1001]|uniref:SH3 domain-containing protein n=1 Tax=Butyrivibrio sp. XBB1001 TaxID=1280682 RepID=UPI001A982E0A|nr:SH3 domain-containing protein [Butyrivibrio sp. XBB1001]
MKEKRIGIMNLKFCKLVTVMALCANLVMTGCGSSRPLQENGAESASEASSMTSIESASENSSDVADGDTSDENADGRNGDHSSNQASSAASGASDEDEANVESSDNGIVIDTKVDKTKITYFDEPVTMYSQRALNVRSGPSTEYDIYGYLEYNTEVQVLGQYDKNGWYLIEFFGGEAFASNRFIAETEVDLAALKAQQEAEALAAIEAQKAAQQAAAQQAPAQQAAQTQTQPAQAAAPASPAPVAAPAGVLFIGDSRCVQMKAAVDGGGCSWICENAKGYVWLNDTAIARADAIVGKGTKVVICLGVNDTGNIDNYANLVNAYAAVWAQRGAKTYFCSVNPVWENPYRTEEQVKAFNSAMPGKLAGITWLDTHSWLETNGYRLVDGLHYDGNTYINLFNYIIGQI